MNEYKQVIETFKMENELMEFNPSTGEKNPIELQNKDNQDLYKANLVAIEVLEKQLNNGWIPVSERLPRIYEGTCTSEIVLVQGYDKEIDYEWQAMGWYAEETKQWYFAECKSTDKPINWINIIAWQPLPEPSFG